MGLWHSLKSNVSRGFKALSAFTAMRFQQWSSWGYWLPGTLFDYAGKVGDGTGSSTVMAPLLWIARNFPEAPAALWEVTPDGQEKKVIRHDLIGLLRRPNPFYSGRLLWMATITSWNVDGNAYWIKLRNGTGRVVQLWYVPHWLITPKGDAKTFITHYEYRPSGELINLRREDVVHFRFGLDSENMLLGYSPLKSVIREVYTDDEAANYTATLLRNSGVPGLIVAPDSEKFLPTQVQADEVKAYLKAMFSGDKRGEPLVMSAPTKVEQFGFNPEQLTLRDLRRIPEERVSAVLGVPAIVAGLGAGLERSTFTNMGEAREMAYESNIIPSQGSLSADVEQQLFPDFGMEDDAWRFGFDLSKVRVLAEDEYRQAQRLDLGYRGGWVRRAEARRASGLPVEESDEVYMVPLNVATVPADGSEPTVIGAANGAANGGSAAADSDAIVTEVLRRIEQERLAAE